MKVRPTQSRKGVKGQLPLAGSRDGVPCGVWGNAPIVPRLTNPKEAANKGAGSEASLPVTLRVRRRAIKLLFPKNFVKKPKKTALPFLKTGGTVPSFDMLDSFSPTIAHSEFRITYASAFFSAGWNSRLRWYAIASSAEQSIHPTGYASATMTKRSCSSAIIVVAR